MTIKSTGYALNPFTGQMAWVGKQRRPPYYRDSSNSVLVKIDGSDDQLLTFLIGNRLYLVNQDLECNFATTGPGGLDRGTITKNTPYYLYAIVDGNDVKLIASVIYPGDGGPQGYDVWTYIGACASDDGSAVFNQFNASDGFCTMRLTTEEISTSGAATGSYLPYTFNSIPVTTKKIYVQVRCIANAAGGLDAVYVTGNAGSAVEITIRGIASRQLYVSGWLTYYVPNTIYIYSATSDAYVIVYFSGWQEDPMEWM